MLPLILAGGGALLQGVGSAMNANSKNESIDEMLKRLEAMKVSENTTLNKENDVMRSAQGTIMNNMNTSALQVAMSGQGQNKLNAINSQILAKVMPNVIQQQSAIKQQDEATNRQIEGQMIQTESQKVDPWSEGIMGAIQGGMAGFQLGSGIETMQQGLDVKSVAAGAMSKDDYNIKWNPIETTENPDIVGESNFNTDMQSYNPYEKYNPLANKFKKFNSTFPPILPSDWRNK